MMPGFMPRTFTLTNTLTKNGNTVLKQTEHADEPTISAAQVRVTPEELAAALSHLEAGSAGQDGKIAIGKAVEELSLDATPEEVLRAVEAARQQTAHRRRSRRRGLAALIAGLAAVGGLGAAKFVSSPRTVPAAPVVAAPGGTLAALNDEQSAYVDIHGLKQMIDRDPSSQIQVYPHSKGIRWGVIKHGGRVYVQAYTLETTEQSIKSKTFDLRNTEDADLTGRSKGYFVDAGTMYSDVKVTIPVNGLRYKDSQQLSDQAILTVSGVWSDDHLWDNFEHNH